MKFVFLRAKTKETVVKYEGQQAKNDDYFEDSSTSSDLYTVLCNELQQYFEQVEIWYQKDRWHREDIFVHDSGLVERFWPKEFEGLSDKHDPDVLFVRGDMKDYYPLLRKYRQRESIFKIYYSAGHYYLPPNRLQWDLIFVDDPRHIKETKKLAKAPVELFRKTCVDKYFPGGEARNIDVCFVCNGPQQKQKGFDLFVEVMREAKDLKAVCIGLINPEWKEKVKGLPIYFTGHVPRTYIGHIMAHCKVGLVLSNEEDGSPRVIQEYLCSDLPVIVGADTTCSEHYINEETGIRAEEKKAREIARSIKEVIRNREGFQPRKYFLRELKMEKTAEWLYDRIKEHNDNIPDL